MKKAYHRPEAESIREKERPSSGKEGRAEILLVY